MMYSFSVTQQLIVFLRSFALGIIFGLTYSLICFTVSVFIHSERIRHIIADLIFSFLMLFVSFCFVLAFNLGTVRFHLILGVIFGVIIYKLSLGQTTDFLFGRIANCLFCAINPTFLLVKRIFIKINEKICKKTNKKSSECIANKNENVV